MRRLWVVIVFSVMLGCGGQSGSSNNRNSTAESPQPDARRNRVRVGIQQEPESLSPMFSSMLYTSIVCNPIHGYLVRINEQLDLVPDLAVEVPSIENGGISPDYLTYTYRLQPEALWHDGEPVTSHDVKFTWERLMHPDVPVVTREGYDRVERVDTPDDHTVIFHLREIYAPFVLSFSEYAILPKHLLEAVPPGEMHQAAYNRAPIGAGPFKFVEWAAGAYIRLEAFDRYFRGRPPLDTLIYKIIPDENTLFLQLRTGEIEAYDHANTQQYERLTQIAGVRVSKTPALVWEHIDFNGDDPILKDTRVRQAISSAVDRQVLADKIYEGHWKVAYSDQSPLLWAYNPAVESIWPYNPDKAEALLAEAGWVDTDGDGIRDRDGQPLTLTISTTTGRPNRERTEVVIREQLRAVGIDLTIQNYDATRFFGSYQDNGVLQMGAYQLGMYAWESSPDPNSTFLWHSAQVPPNGQNTTRFRNAEMDALLRAGVATVDQEERRRIYYEAQRVLIEEAAVLPLLLWVHIDSYPAALAGVKPNPSQQTNSWNTWEWRWVDSD